MTYSIRFGNSGSLAATNIQIMDNLPVGMTYISSSISINGVIRSDYTLSQGA
jgi:uncharacterized repeat protein (TIGR01451 family)